MECMKEHNLGACLYWINADEYPPINNGQYLTCVQRKAPEELGGNSKQIKILKWIDGNWRMPVHFPKWINDTITEKVIYWQPLPEMPNE